MTRHYRLAGFAAVACASLAACAPYPVYPGTPTGYPGPAPYAYDQGGVYVQPAPYETFGFGGGYVDGGGWRRDRDWRGGGDNGWHGDRPRDNGGQRYGGEGFHGTGRQAPQAPPRFGGGGGGGGSGFHGVAPASAPRPAPAPAQGGGKPMQWWKGS